MLATHPPRARLRRSAPLRHRGTPDRAIARERHAGQSLPQAGSIDGAPAGAPS